MNCIDQRIEAFSKLGEIFKNLFSQKAEEQKAPLAKAISNLKSEINKLQLTNTWFIPNFTENAIHSLGKMLEKENLEKWLKQYPNLSAINNKKTVAVIMAGNLPLVGFHDFLCVLLSGHSILVRLSSNDKILLPKIAEILQIINPEFKDSIKFTSQIIKDYDAIIATGSDNSSRYFEFYFGKYPNIIRKNRNSVAILNGDETADDLKMLAEDIFLYFGLGCRSISKIYIPEGFKISKILDSWEDFVFLKDHSSYFNNYEYNKSIYLINEIPHLDNGFAILKEDTKLNSPLSVIHFEYYNSKNSVMEVLKENREKIQCICQKNPCDKDFVPLGETQSPQLWDYADNIDTLDFLIKL
ncbi:MAG: acyl-CoA reductase [Bacteroidales bacterium]